MKTQNKTYITVEIEVNVRSAANSYDTGDKLANSTVKYEATLPVVEAAESVVKTLCTEAMKQVIDELQRASEAEELPAQRPYEGKQHDDALDTIESELGSVPEPLPPGLKSMSDLH